jgi:hypothetical protein
MGCAWAFSFDDEAREKEQRYREKIRRKLEKYNSMIDKAKVKQQIKADIMQVLKEAMNQEIPEHVLRNRVRSAVWRSFSIFEERGIFDDVFIDYHRDDKFYRTIDELEKGSATAAIRALKDEVVVRARIVLETMDMWYVMSTGIETLDEYVELAKIKIDYDAEIKKQNDKYFVKILRIYDVDAIVY